MADTPPNLTSLIRKSEQRTDLLKELAEAGVRRRDAQREATKQINQIRRLAQRAVGAGMTLTEIAEAAQISRVTLNRLLDSKPKLKPRKVRQKTA